MPSPANPSHAMATVLVDELARCGLRDVCLSPGSRSAALALAAEEHPGVRTHVVLDERSAAFLAIGLVRGAGRPAAVLTTSGTATANLHPAVIEADADRIPLIVLTADRPPEQRDAGANQTIDQVSLYGGAVRWAVDLAVAEDRADANAYWRSTVCHAWAAATGVGGPRGPVHLNVPFREPLVPVEVDARGTTQGAFTHRVAGRPAGAPWTAHGPAEHRASPATVEALAERIATTERGLLVVGGTDGTAGDDAEPFLALAARTGWPLLAEPHSGARSGGNAIGAYDLILAARGDADAHRPELVVRVGAANLSRDLARLLRPEVGHILLDRDGARLDPTRSVDTVVTGDPAATARRLAEALDRRPLTRWLGAWIDAERAAQDAIDAVLADEQRPTEPATARALTAAIPGGSAIVAGSSLPIRHLARFARPRSGIRILGNRGASGIDGFSSTALGVARSHPGPTYALCGDLTFLHDTGGLDAARDDDLVIVVLDNDGGGIFSRLPQAEHPAHFERLFGTPHGVDLGAVARAHRAGHRRVEEAHALRAALDTAAAEGGVQVVEVATDRAYEADLDVRLRASVATALGG